MTKETKSFWKNISTLRKRSNDVKPWHAQWTLTFDVRVRWPHTARVLPGGLYVSYPCPLALRQEVVAFSHNRAATVTSDEYGNHWLLLDLSHERSDVHLSYQAVVATSPLMFDVGAFGDAVTPAHSRFLQAERGIETNHPTVAALAQKITARTQLAILQECFALVRKNLHYRVQKKEYGALYAASQGQGDCTEYASLLAALLRYHNIGARLTIGYMPDGVLHAITEAYLDGLWVPIDVTNAPDLMLGLPYDFVALMHANWMSAGRIEKLISFYYGRKAGSRCRPHIALTASLRPLAAPKVMLLGDAPSAIVPLPSRSDVKIVSPLFYNQLDRGELAFRLRLWHDRSYTVSGHLLLLAGDTVCRIYPCTVEAERETLVEIPLADCRRLWREWHDLRLVFCDPAEQSHPLATLTKPTTVHIR
jgi:hypothetical protein